MKGKKDKKEMKNADAFLGFPLFGFLFVCFV
jgi:hypothetical protein